jgi:two-component system, cell cycle sensor histidine kinase and response regulator CckA
MPAQRPPVRSAPRTRRVRRGPQLAWRQLALGLRNLGDGAMIAGSRWQRGGLDIFYANEALCAMTGHPAAELVGNNSRLFSGPRSDTTRLRRWLRTARRGQVHHGEGYVYRKDGTMFYAAWSFSPLDDGPGRPVRLVAVYRDMTEMRRLQDILVHSQRLDAVGQLAGGVAHDFNNLLSVINGYCEILGGRLAENAAARRDLEEIHKAGQKAAALTRQLLAFSRRQEMDPKVVNLNQIIRELGELLQRLVGPVSTLELDLAVDLGNIRADPALIQQVVLNLVINARDALPVGGGAVTVRTASTVVPPGLHGHSASEIQPGRYAMLAVRDTGEGMDPETQRRLFEPFFTTKDPGKGTGLGLSTVYGIVKQSGGYVTVQSDLKIGSTFAVYLPEVSEPADAREASLLPLPDTRGRETILLFEQDALVGKMVAGILTAEGYEVLAANRPPDALAMAKRHGRPIDLLITDLADPQGLGLELARELQTLKPGFRILSTSNQEEARPVPWLPAAHQAHIVKPFALHQVLRRARELLDAKMVL